MGRARGKGIDGAEGAESREKGRECSTWIFVQKPLVTPLSTVNSSRAAANAGSATFSTARRKLKHRLVSSQFIEYTVGQNAHFQI